MEQNVIQKNMWNTAGAAGLVLGLTSTAFLFISQGLVHLEMSALPLSIISLALWAVKFAGCIWLMKFFMKQFVADNCIKENSQSFRFGVVTALLSALVYAAASFANVAFISPDLYAEQMEMTMQQMAPMMDSNTQSMLERYFEILPQITFVSNLIYCFIYGTVLSFILSRNIPSTDPFADYKPAE